MKLDRSTALIIENPAFVPFFRGLSDNKGDSIPLARLFGALKKYRVLDQQIFSEDFAIFSDNKLKTAFERFTASYPVESLPLRLIRINQRIPSARHSRHFEIITRDLLNNNAGIAFFRDKFNIKIAVDIRFREFDAGKAITLCETLIENNIDVINFIFDFPEITVDSAASFIPAIKLFCGSSILKDQRIRLVNLPFCFIPDAKYPLLYRNITGTLKGNIRVQRNTVRELKKKKFAFFEPCRICRCKIPCYNYTDIQRFSGYSRFLSPKTQSTVVFSGGSLRETDKQGDNDIVYALPIRQGDMFATILEGFRNILIIDGYFYNDFPCTTFEVLLAIEEGRNVFGAGSIGALRAVELHNYGMLGSGYVFNYLKRKKIKPYQIVAQTYDGDNKPVSVPLINVVYFLKSALKKRIISRSEFDKCFNAANDIHFAALTFPYFFKYLGTSGRLPGRRVERLKNYFYLEGEDGFNVKRKDALLLLKNFRSIIAGRADGHAAKTFIAAKDKYLKMLASKYAPDNDLTLPKYWQKPLGVRAGSGVRNTKNARDLSPEKTCRLAAGFFAGLDIVIGDVSKYEQLKNAVINVFFIPFYFLEYFLSCANGMGRNTEEALACAYMECLERIPRDWMKSGGLPAAGIEKNKIYPPENIPQFYNFRIPSARKRKIIREYGNVKVSEIMGRREFYIPGSATFYKFSGTDGNASGNTYAEAVLYGIYELIERDLSMVYGPGEFVLESKLIIDNGKIKDARSLALIKEFEKLGCKVFISNLVNIYGVVCIRCRVFDLNNRIIRHGGTVARLDFEAAVYESLFEAYMQYMTDFAGSRDDYTTLQNPNRDFQRFYHFYRDAKYNGKCASAVNFASVRDELYALLEKLRAAGVKDILVADLSPKKQYLLKSVKVIIPGMELMHIPAYKPSRWREQKLKNTLSRIQAYLDRQ